MDFRILAVDELRRYKSLLTASQTTKLKIIELEGMLKSSGGGSGGEIAGTGGGNKTEHKRLSLISSIDDEKGRLKSAARGTKRVELALESLNEEEAQILKALYIDGQKIDTFAEKEHMSRATAYRLREIAVINFTRSLYGAVIT